MKERIYVLADEIIDSNCPSDSLLEEFAGLYYKEDTTGIFLVEVDEWPSENIIWVSLQSQKQVRSLEKYMDKLRHPDLYFCIEYGSRLKICVVNDSHLQIRVKNLLKAIDDYKLLNLQCGKNHLKRWLFTMNVGNGRKYSSIRNKMMFVNG